MHTETFFVNANGRSYTFFGDFEFDKDINDCMGTATLTVPYHPQLWAFWEPGSLEVEVYGGTYKEEKLVAGRVRSVQQVNDKITIKIQDHGWKLKQLYKGTYKDKPRIQILRELIKGSGMIPIIDPRVPDDKISQQEEETETSGTASTTTAATSSSTSLNTVTGQFKPSCKHCPSKYRNGKYYTTTTENKCPVCHTVGKIKYAANLPHLYGKWYKKPCAAGGSKGMADNKVVEGHYWCCQCGADFCGIDGWDHSERGRLNIVSGPSETTKTPAQPGTPGAIQQSETIGESSTPTYEDEIRKICEDIGTIAFNTTQNNECIVFMVDDQENLSNPYPRQVIEPWMIENESFDLEVSQFGFANTVILKYAKGTIKESYEDLVSVFGEVVVNHSAPNVKTESRAREKAKAILANTVKDFGMEIRVNVLWQGMLQPGNWAFVTNPLTNNKELYMISGVNASMSSTSTLKASMTLRYAPENPQVSNIPEIKGTNTQPDELTKLAKKLGSLKSICNWVDTNVKYDPYYGRIRSPLEVYNTRLGNCWDQSELVIALASVLGYSGTSEHTTCNGIAHRNAVFHINNQRIVCDPTCKKLNQMK